MNGHIITKASRWINSIIIIMITRIKIERKDDHMITVLNGEADLCRMKTLPFNESNILIISKYVRSGMNVHYSYLRIFSLYKESYQNTQELC